MRSTLLRWVVVGLFVALGQLFMFSQAGAFTRTLAFPPSSECSPTAPPLSTGSYSAFPGHWWNPHRGGTGWEFFFSTNNYYMVDVIWLTFDGQNRPVWLSNGGGGVITGVEANTGALEFWAPLLLVTMHADGTTSYVQVGEVAITFLPHSLTQAALRWRWDNVTQQQPDECVYNFFKGTLPSTNAPINESYTGNWYAPTQAGWGFLVTENADPTTQALTELSTPVIFDKTGYPIWLFGLYGTPTSGATGADTKYYPTYGISGYPGGFPTKNCVNNCFTTLGDLVSNPSIERTFTSSSAGTAVVIAKFLASQTGPGTNDIDWPAYPARTANGSAALFPSTPVAITKLTDYNIVLVSRTDCEIPVGQTTCPVTVSWDSGDNTAHVYSYDIPSGYTNPTPLGGSNGQVTLNLPAGSDTQYKLINQNSPNGAVLFTSSEVKVTAASQADAPPVSQSPAIASTPATDATSDKVGVTLGEFRVDEGGNATYTVPIQVPPGTAGVTPKVALFYNSRLGNGVMGPGWSIQGSSQITRCRQTRESGDFIGAATPDGNPLPVNFTQATDRFCLDGVRLLKTSPGNYGDNATIYSPENDPTTKVTAIVTNAAAGPDSFTVQRKDGTTSTYGYTTAVSGNNARIAATLPSTNSTVYVDWNLARSQDSTGNYIDYTYNIQPGASSLPFAPGAVEFTLASIKYTGHATTPVSQGYASISFSYNTLTAPYVRLGYQSGVAFLQSQQLQSVTVQDQITTSARTLRYYVLSYQTSISGSNFQQLKQVKECRDATALICFNPTTFGWSAATYALAAEATPQIQSGPDFQNLVGWKMADVDGDGRQDFVFAKNNDSHCGPQSAIYVGFLDQRATSHQMTLSIGTQTPTCAPIDLSGKDTAWYLVDYNNDGRADLLLGDVSGQQWKLYTSVGRPSASSPAFATAGTLPITVPANADPQAILADVNGDGLPDLITPDIAEPVNPIQNLTGYAQSQLSVRFLQPQPNGTLAFSSPVEIVLHFSASDTHCAVGSGYQCTINFFNSNYVSGGAITNDVDGDGRADLTFLLAATPCNPCQQSAVVGFDPNIGKATTGHSATPGGIIYYWYQFTAAGVSYLSALNTNVLLMNQYNVIDTTADPTVPTSFSNFFVADLTGDGLADILYQEVGAPAGTYCVRVNSGYGYFPAACQGLSGFAAGSARILQFADANGDGKIDLVYPTSGTNYSYVSVVPSTASNWAFSAPTDMGAGFQTGSVWIPILGDFDGDGVSDFIGIRVDNYASGNLATARAAGNNVSTTCLSATNLSTCSRYHPHDVVTTITNGFSATTTLVYQPLTNNGVYERAGSPNTPVVTTISGYGSPVFDIIAPMYVVSQAISSAPLQTNSGATSSISYLYKGARVQAGGRGFEGFRSTWAFDANDQSVIDGQQFMVTWNTYNQTFPFIGTPLSTYKVAMSGAYTLGTALMDGCAANIETFSYNCFANPGSAVWPDVTQTGRIVSNSENLTACIGNGCTTPQATVCSSPTPVGTPPNEPGTFSPPSSAGPLFTFTEATSDTQYDLTAGTALAQTSNYFCYEDGFTNVTHATTVTADGTGATVAQKFVANTYTNDTADWYLGRLTHSSVQFVRPGKPSVPSRTTDFCYDLNTNSGDCASLHSNQTNTGILLSERIEAGLGAGLDLRTVYTIDQWGNRTGAYQCSGADFTTALSCVTGSSATQRQISTYIYRYATTTYDSAGRYATSSTLPFYTDSGTTHINPLPAYTIASRDEFGNVTQQKSLNDNSGFVRNAQAATHWALYGVLGRPYFSADDSGKSSTTTYRTCAFVTCPSDATFRSQTLIAGAPSSWTYFDRLGRPILAISQSFDANSSTRQFSGVCSYYDAHSRPVYKSEPFFVTATVYTDGSPSLNNTTPCSSATYATSTVFDALGRVKKVTNPDGGIVNRTYMGLTTFTSSPRNANWEADETRNALGEVTQTIDLSDGTSQTGLEVDTDYDAAGNVLTVTRNAGSGVIQTSMTYDALGRKATLSDPDAGLSSYYYNAAGDVIHQVDAKSQHVYQNYDAMGRRWQRFTNGAADLNNITDTWKFDVNAGGYGQLAIETRTSSTGTPFTRTLSYDTLGRLSQRSTTIGTGSPYAEASAYDQYGRPMAQQDAAGYTLTNNYTTNGFLSFLTDSRAGLLYEVLAMTERGKVTSERRAGTAALATTLSYYPSTGRIGAICTGINCGLQHYGYAFDLLGNLSTRTRYGSSTITETFTNDAANRLIQATLTTGTTTATTLTVTYDQLGNVCSKNGVTYSYAGLAGCANHGSFGSPHATTQIGGGTSYQYDADGNQYNGPANGDTRNLTYNALNQVTSAKLVASGQTTTFQYDPDGGRFQRVDNGSVTTTYVGNVEILNNGAVTENRRYLGGVAIDYVRSTLRNQTMFVFTDHLGSTDLLTNPDGTIVETMSFDAYGNYRNASTWAAGTTQQTGIGSPNTRHGFTGHEHVDSMGLVHMNGRIYDPVMGRMLQADPLTGPGPQGLNRYSYVANNPLSLTDPTGYSWWGDLLKDAAIVAITVYTGGAGAALWAEESYAEAVLVVGAGGFAAGAVQTGNLRGAVFGAFSAELFFGVGQYFDQAGWAHTEGDIGASNLNSVGYTAKMLAHGVAGGVMSSLQGGKFGSGFLAAGVSEAAGPGIDKLDPSNQLGVSVSAERVVAAAIVGGTTSVLAGGKFSNGAITAAFGRAFNEESNVKPASRSEGAAPWDISYTTSGPATYPPSLYPDTMISPAADDAAMRGLNPKLAPYTNQGEWDGSIISAGGGVYPSYPVLQTITVTASGLQTSFPLSPNAIAIFHAHIRTGNRGADNTQVPYGPLDPGVLMRDSPLPNYWRDPFGAVRVIERYQGELTNRYVGQEPRN